MSKDRSTEDDRSEQRQELRSPEPPIDSIRVRVAVKETGELGFIFFRPSIGVFFIYR